MDNLSLRRAFVIFHCTLAAVIFFESLNTALQTHSAHKFGPMSAHIALLAGIEAIAAVLFLFPKTLRVGGALLLLIFAIAVAVHGVRAELPLLVYAAGVALVRCMATLSQKICSTRIKQPPDKVKRATTGRRSYKD